MKYYEAATYPASSGRVISMQDDSPTAESCDLPESWILDWEALEGFKGNREVKYVMCQEFN